MFKTDKRRNCDYNIESIVRSSELGKKSMLPSSSQVKFSKMSLYICYSFGPLHQSARPCGCSMVSTFKLLNSISKLSRIANIL